MAGDGGTGFELSVGGINLAWPPVREGQAVGFAGVGADNLIWTPFEIVGLA